MTATARAWLLVMIVLLIAVNVAIGTAWISTCNGRAISLRVRDAVVAFGSTIGLGFAILSASHLL